MKQAGPTGDPQLFLVRVWRQPDRFRASVCCVDEDRPHWFTNVAQLASFLGSSAEAPRRAAAPSGDGDAGESDESRP